MANILMDLLDAMAWPGDQFRGLLSGQFGQRTSGREMLENLGLVGPNTPEWDMGDIAGGVAQLGLDPLMYLPLAAPAAMRGIRSMSPAMGAGGDAMNAARLAELNQTKAAAEAALAQQAAAKDAILKAQQARFDKMRGFLDPSALADDTLQRTFVNMPPGLGQQAEAMRMGNVVPGGGFRLQAGGAPARSWSPNMPAHKTEPMMIFNPYIDLKQSVPKASEAFAQGGQLPLGIGPTEDEFNLLRSFARDAYAHPDVQAIAGQPMATPSLVPRQPGQLPPPRPITTGPHAGPELPPDFFSNPAPSGLHLPAEARGSVGPRALQKSIFDDPAELADEMILPFLADKQAGAAGIYRPSGMPAPIPSTRPSHILPKDFRAMKRGYPAAQRAFEPAVPRMPFDPVERIFGRAAQTMADRQIANLPSPMLGGRAAGDVLAEVNQQLAQLGTQSGGHIAAQAEALTKQYAPTLEEIIIRGGPISGSFGAGLGAGIVMKQRGYFGDL